MWFLGTQIARYYNWCMDVPSHPPLWRVILYFSFSVIASIPPLYMLSMPYLGAYFAISHTTIVAAFLLFVWGRIKHFEKQWQTDKSIHTPNTQTSFKKK
ncbi:hypothetical protein ROA7450_03156 [Roseovarius albus]|uniref:Uncharacterized protein n=1 Tax=Roseovarius albus TaxID=1247867 RepID=A0A1X6ZVR2_9RHOB|nr:hypothetical protein ROA7450_03156 [Roseovarius albus]